MGGGGGGAARLEDELVWVRAAARRLARRSRAPVEVDELVACGSEGLVEAARSFDPKRGVPFGAYARARVQGAMLDGLRALAPLPRSLHRAQLADAADARGVEARHRARFAAAQGDGLLFETALSAEGQPIAASADLGPETLAELGQLRRRVARALAELPAAESELVRRHALEEQPLAQAAESLGLGEARAARLYRRALLRLRAVLRDSAF
jgi:RNA polymerase sigma factor for flagellar operon FliA